MEAMPKHYRLETHPLMTGNLDKFYKDGWRVVCMTAHPDGDHVILLMEKVSADEGK